MGVFERFWRWLTGSGGRSKGEYADPRNSPIDVPRLVKELEVEKVAREAGEKCLPDWSTQNLSGAEHQILLEVQRAQDGYGHWASQRLAVLNQEISACDLVTIINRAKQVGKEFERNASALLGAWRSELTRLQSKRDSRAAEFGEFKRRNRLEREPDYPSPGRKFLGFAILIVLVVGEGAMNSFFFARGMWGGLLSGLIVAMLFSAVNIALAYAFGRIFAGFVHHVSWWKKGPAIISMAIYCAILVGLALSIGHFRDALGEGPVNAESRALQSIFNDPFTLKDFQSVILSIASVLCGIFAFIDAYMLEDAYPGYGKRHRRLLESMDEYERQKGALLAELDRDKTAALYDLEKLYNDASVELKSLDAAMNQKEITRQSFEGGVQEVEKAANTLLGIFRAENMKARPAECRAVQFPTSPGAVVPKLDFNLSHDREKYEAQLAELAILKSQIQEIRAQIQSSFNQQVNAQLPVDTIIAGLPPPAPHEPPTA